MKAESVATSGQSRPRRANYFLYTWQIRAIQKMSRDTQKTSSEILRELLSEALASRTAEK